MQKINFYWTKQLIMEAMNCIPSILDRAWYWLVLQLNALTPFSAVAIKQLDNL
jgi:hypothetical protein